MERQSNPYNVPGMLVWQRDSAHSFNDVANNLNDPPSIGAKGSVLLVDANFEPTRMRGAAAEANPSLLDNLSSRASSRCRVRTSQLWVPVLLPV